MINYYMSMQNAQRDKTRQRNTSRLGRSLAPNTEVKLQEAGPEEWKIPLPLAEATKTNGQREPNGKPFFLSSLPHPLIHSQAVKCGITVVET